MVGREDDEGVVVDADLVQAVEQVAQHPVGELGLEDMALEPQVGRLVVRPDVVDQAGVAGVGVGGAVGVEAPRHVREDGVDEGQPGLHARLDAGDGLLELAHPVALAEVVDEVGSVLGQLVGLLVQVDRALAEVGPGVVDRRRASRRASWAA